MMIETRALPLALALMASTVGAFQSVDITPTTTRMSTTGTALAMDRRNFGAAVIGGIVAGNVWNPTKPAMAEVFLDPAMYGDQELRVSAVDSIKEKVRRAILQKPVLAPSFYQLSLLDGLSYNERTKKYGPDGSVVANVLSSKSTDTYTQNLQEACNVLIEGAKALKRKTAITVSDAVAIGGAEAIESVGGPVLAVQLGRMEPAKGAPLPPLPVDLFSGTRSASEVSDAFRSAGLTEREMTALLSGLMTLELVEKSRSAEDWKESAKPKFRERGKMGRMSEFKQLTDEDIANAEAAEFDDDDDGEDPLFDDGRTYIADSFGTRDERFGKRIGAEQIDEKTFNKYLKELDEASSKKKGGNVSDYGWIGVLLADGDVTQTWLKKYAGSNLNYLKDLKVSFNAVTQLGAVYTGGKYESLLKNKGRKTLNDDQLNLF
ncbi:Peroxidase [Seminavis robusta]|uniref:Peroxidase n=1 Tax=Seminavis robusta TaxID=568900 RepID=A0A9N8HLZ2_9STRA|nr:Peroxidase [Seminavis robusta]|eukprot:Sro1070_g237790.1 Peroxidase (433) ;mRNA; r:25138-26542